MPTAVAHASDAPPVSVAAVIVRLVTELELPAQYGDVLAQLKRRVHEAQLQARKAVSAELTHLYWDIGATILKQQSEAGWGGKVVDRLAHDLRQEFPDMKGFSRRNLLYMRRFAQAWPGPFSNVPSPMAHLPWTHIRTLFDRLDDADERVWYAAKAVEHGWTVVVLEHQIMGQLRQREGAAPANFHAQLERSDSELAQQLAKDPYILDFLELTAEAAERDLEKALVANIVKVLRELGPEWAFVDQQRRIEVGAEEFYIDLLFFHTSQLRFIVIELKTGKFKPEYVGQLGFYVNVVDDLIRKEGHAPTVGILLCTSKDQAVVRYALGASDKPMAVSSFTYEKLPAAERELLPDVERLTRALESKAVSDE